MDFSKIIPVFLLLSSLACGQPQVEYFDAQPNPVYLDAFVTFSIEASSDGGIGSIYLEDVSGGITSECECGGSEECSLLTCRCVDGPCFRKAFDSVGSYEFCARADGSAEVCLNISVITVSECDAILMDDSSSEVQIASKIKTQRIRKGILGFDGYPLDCCPYCEEILINNSDCRMLGGSLALNYTLVYYNHSSNETYGDLRFPRNIRNISPNPLVLCSAVVDVNQTVLGIVDVVEFHLIESVYNEERMKHWLIETGVKKTEPWQRIKIEALKEAAKGFVNISINRGKKVGLVSFSQSAYIDSYLTSDKATLNAIIDSYTPYGATNMEDAIRKGIDVLESNGGARTMVFMSDGKNTVNYSNPIAAANDAKDKDIVINTIALGNDADRVTLKKIADITDGKFYEVGCDNSLKSIYEELANMLEDTVLVSDISGSMIESQRLVCYEYALKYSIVDQKFSNKTETKEYIIMDSDSYSNAVNKLLEDECYHKQPETIECHFDCEYIPGKDCDPKEGCDAPCPCYPPIDCPSPICGCCPECHQYADYIECFYKKLERMYGRPYVDYLYCWKTPLEDTAWCHQRMDLASSTIEYPWYALTNVNYSSRNLNLIDECYINETHEWNLNQEITEMPDPTVIKIKEKTPEKYCNHEFEEKLFRNVWAKIFTITPYLEDYRNNMTWSRTGPGAVYAGGGFRREPSCWWEDCRQCGPMTNCDCAPCCNYCCLYAYYIEGVTKVMEFTIRSVTIQETPVTKTTVGRNQIKLSNGALTVISTGNFPFDVTWQSFTKDPATGIYTLTLYYTPIGDAEHDPSRHQFIIAEDIVLNYNLSENAGDLLVRLRETVSSKLKVDTCSCQWIWIGTNLVCACLPSGSVIIPTTETISDGIGTAVLIDTIKLSALQDAANGFVDTALDKDVDEIGLVAFSQGSPADCTPDGICSWLDLTDDRAALHTEINSYWAHHGTCASCGLNKGRSLLGGVSGDKYIVLLSDGNPNCCTPSGMQCSLSTARSQAISQAGSAKASGITVHTVALGDDALVDVMEDIADAGGGECHVVDCDCPLNCIYEKLANSLNGSVVLVNDVSGSMAWDLTLDCPGKGIPIVYKFGKINVTVTGNIDNLVDEFITHRGQLNITVEPDILNEFTLSVANLSLVYTSLLYPVKHESFRKEFLHGQWEYAYPYTGHPTSYGYLPGSMIYVLNTSYGYEERIPTPVDYEFPYPEQGGEICPPECFCPAYDLTDVTCIDYSTDPPSFYKRDDCICPVLAQSYKSQITSQRTYHEEESYYYDFVHHYTQETDELKVMGKERKERPVPPVGGLSGNVRHGLPGDLMNDTNITIDCTQSTSSNWDISSSAVLLPTDPADALAGDSQSEPLLVHGLAWHIAYCAKNPARCGLNPENNVTVGRIIGPINLLGVQYNAGPYIVIAEEGNETEIMGEVINKFPQFNGVDYSEIGSDVTAKAKPLFPLKICIEDGEYDKPSLIFDKMGVPYSDWAKYPKDCFYTANVLIFGCAEGPLDESITKEEIQGFVSGECGVYVASDWGYDPLNVIFAGYFSTAKTASGTLNLWEGSANGFYDLPVDLREFFQTPYESIPNWHIGLSTAVITSIDDSDTDVLARGDYTSGGNNKPMIVTFPYGNGRVFYSTMHLNDAETDEQKAFIASFYLAGSGVHREAPYRDGVGKKNSYILDFTALSFPKPLTREDFENSSLTIFIHFRNDTGNQTFSLFPPHSESKPYFNLDVDVSMRDATKILIEEVIPGRYNLLSGSDIKICIRLIDAITGEGVPSADVNVIVEAYKLSQVVTTDPDGRATFHFKVGDDSTRVYFTYPGNERLIESKTSDYYDVVSLSKIGWLISPEALLLLIVLLMLAFSYRWFKGKRLGADDMLNELKGEK